MKVYLVMHRVATYECDTPTVSKIFDSEIKAKQYIEETYASYTYIVEDEIWIYEDTYDTSEVWFEEWEVQ